MFKRVRPIIILILIASLVLFLFSKIYILYSQEGNPLPIAAAAANLYFDQNHIETISNSPQTYIIRTDNGLSPFISLMESNGWHYKEQLGAVIFFDKNNESLTAVGRMYSKYFMLISVPSKNPNSNTAKSVASITATGDILMHNTVIASGLQDNSYNFDHLFAPIKHLIEAGDYASVNLESALAGPATGYTGYPVFNSPDSIATALKTAGFDLTITGSNHTLDRGYQGALRTIDVLRQAGLDTTGTFKTPEDRKTPLIKNINGIKFGYLAYSYDTNGIPLPKDKPYFYNLLDEKQIITDISTLRPQVDVVVLVLHWGVEYSPYPTEQQRKLAMKFFAEGADVILGSHPHVIQPMETVKINGKDKFVIYSMGNSMGNQNGVERNSGVVLKLDFSKDASSGETTLTGVKSTPTYIHSYYDNGRQLFRVVPIEETIQAIKEGKDPYLGADSIPTLENVLAATNKTLTQPLK